MAKNGVKMDPTPEERAQVLALATYGIPQTEIAKFLDCAEKTLRLHFREELDTAMIDKEEKVRRFLFGGATGEALDPESPYYNPSASYNDCTRLAMFWAKTQLGFKEKQDINHTSEDGSMSPKGRSLEDFYSDDVSTKS